MWEMLAALAPAIGGLLTWAWKIPDHFEKSVGLLHSCVFAATCGVVGYFSGYKHGSDEALAVSYADMVVASAVLFLPIAAVWGLLLFAEHVVARHSINRRPNPTTAEEIQRPPTS